MLQCFLLCFMLQCFLLCFMLQCYLLLIKLMPFSIHAHSLYNTTYISRTDFQKKWHICKRLLWCHKEYNPFYKSSNISENSISTTLVKADSRERNGQISWDLFFYLEDLNWRVYTCISLPLFMAFVACIYKTTFF